MAPNVVWVQTMAPNVCRKTQLRLFRGITPKTDLHVLCGKNVSEKGAQKLFGQVLGNSDKSRLHPQKFACSYTYV